MHVVREINKDTFFVGGSDRRIELFENVYPLSNGVSYNSYLITDEKTVLIDTVDKSISGLFFENIKHVLNGRKLDYLICNHMEPDHCQTMEELVVRYDEVKIVCNKKTMDMIKQFFTFDIDSRVVLVKEGSTFSTGSHEFTFVMAPMVHWPEVMVTYDITTKTLFSADAFGTFGALNGNVFADEVDFDGLYMDEARRYYTNIVGKYGNQVQSLLKKAATIEIDMICPLHGFVWRRNINKFVDKYIKWSTYTSEETGVLICYASVYGNTENVCNIVANKLSMKGIRNIKMYDVSKTHPSFILAEVFKYSHIVFASTTYNAGIFVNMENLLHDIKAHNLQNKTVGIIENGSWAPTSGKLMHEILGSLKGITFINEQITIKSSIKENQEENINLFVDEIYSSMAPEKKVDFSGKIDGTSLFKLSYGLYLLSAKQGNKDNGCIINTVMQITDDPKRIAIAVNKNNLTYEMIKKSLKFNVSVLTTKTNFKIIEDYGFKSGRNVNKFENSYVLRSSNDLVYLNTCTNAYLSCDVIEMHEYDTHMVFIGEVTEGKVLNNDDPLTYEYYLKNVKPQPNKLEEKKGYICQICGYIHEGDELPADYICPLCLHGVDYFEKL